MLHSAVCASLQVDQSYWQSAIAAKATAAVKVCHRTSTVHA